MRSGIFGPMEFANDAIENEERGQFAGRDFLGPVYGRAEDFLRAMASSDSGRMSNFWAKQMPGQSWLRPAYRAYIED